MTALRERRAALGLVQMNLWIREEDRAEFEAAMAPFRERAAAIDPTHKPGRKPVEAVRDSIRRLERSTTERPPQASQKPVRRHPTPKPRITLPCRLSFPSTPPAALRNEMKAAGWQYDRTTGLWSTNDTELADDWLPDLTEKRGARIVGLAENHAGTSAAPTPDPTKTAPNQS